MRGEQRGGGRQRGRFASEERILQEPVEEVEALLAGAAIAAGQPAAVGLLHPPQPQQAGRHAPARMATLASHIVALPQRHRLVTSISVSHRTGNLTRTRGADEKTVRYLSLARIMPCDRVAYVTNSAVKVWFEATLPRSSLGLASCSIV
ncbi:hypothetical protein AAG570_000975 [Ranatra chinensis]|uniref:Uncharacterized protein n=1 Tax=Ranatra chinensis TaxID=642074 RepID=A0ABD0YAG6_9HEMI